MHLQITLGSCPRPRLPVLSPCHTLRLTKLIAMHATQEVKRNTSCVPLRFGTLQPWPCRRKTYRPDAITWQEIEPEAVTGKQFRLGVRDKQGRAVLVMRPRSVILLIESCTGGSSSTTSEYSLPEMQLSAPSTVMCTIWCLSEHLTTFACITSC